MLKPHAMAGSLAGLSAIMYVVFYMIAQISPDLFQFLFDAQFFGAKVASATPDFNFGGLFALVVTTWIVGYVWAMLYNKLAK